MNILIACEESQTVCKEFREKGHKAFSCDIQECSGGHPEWHIIGDVIPLLNGNCSFICQNGDKHNIKGEWDMIIAHPPCTYMSKAGARHMYPKAGIINKERLRKALEAKEFFFKIWNAACKRICIENPTPLKVIQLPKPSQVIEPYYFGEPYSKRTLLWEKGLPALKPTKILREYSPYLPSNTSKKSKGMGGSYGVANNARLRSKTFKGIAVAMSSQWG